MAKKAPDFCAVPTCVEEVTAAWCEAALRSGGCLGPEVSVARVEAERLSSDSSDISDGGGLSGSLMVKIKLEYRYNTQPSTIHSYYLLLLLMLMLLQRECNWRRTKDHGLQNLRTLQS